MHPIITELKEIIRINGTVPPLVLRSLLKEHLQNYVLDCIYESPKYKHLIFYGGTCLRKIYNLDRMSEDLDFEADESFRIEPLSDILKEYFLIKLQFDNVDIKCQSGDKVNRITIKFPILNELGISTYQNENLHIKVEVNKTDNINFPTEITPLSISKFTIFIKHYDLGTLMAGKIIACIDRSFKKGKNQVNLKGRDYYDLIWYMQKGIKPNKDRIRIYNKDFSVKKAFVEIDKKVGSIKSDDLYLDLNPFFIKQEYIKTWCENFHLFYKKYKANIL